MKIKAKQLLYRPYVPLEEITSRIGIVLTFLYMLLGYIVSMLTAEGSRVGGYALIAVIFLTLAVYILQGNLWFRIRFSYLHVNIVLFGLYCILTSFWAQRSQIARSKGIDILEIAVAVTVLYLFYEKKNTIRDLLKVVMYACYGVVVYAILYYGVNQIMELLLSAKRVSNAAVNANTLGMCAAYAMIINLYFIFYDKKLRLTDLLMVVAVPMLIISSSRKAMVMIAAGLLGLFVLRSWDRKKLLRSVTKLLLALVVLVAIFLFIYQLPIFQTINKRMIELFNVMFSGEVERSNSAWIRLEYNKLGIQLFKEHPVFGIGIGNANIYTMMYYEKDHFLHNNYIELLACSGLLGTGIYYSIYALVLFRMVRYLKYRDGEFDICLILLLIYLVMDYGMVDYFDKTTYVFLMLFWHESVVLRRRAKAHESLTIPQTVSHGQ